MLATQREWGRWSDLIPKGMLKGWKGSFDRNLKRTGGRMSRPLKGTGKQGENPMVWVFQRGYFH